MHQGDGGSGKMDGGEMEITERPASQMSSSQGNAKITAKESGYL